MCGRIYDTWTIDQYVDSKVVYQANAIIRSLGFEAPVRVACLAALRGRVFYKDVVTPDVEERVLQIGTSIYGGKPSRITTHLSKFRLRVIVLVHQVGLCNG